MRLFAGFRKLGTRLGREQSGSTAVEFAMVIGPFLGLLFAIIETSLVYFAEYAFDNAVVQASRKMLTGAAQGQNMSEEQFKKLVCQKLPSFVVCDNSVIIDVRAFDTFAEAADNMPKPLKPNGELSDNFQQFKMGGSAKVMVVSVFYDWKLFATLPGLGDFTGKVGLGLGNLPDGSRLISATTVFRTETF